MRDIFKQYNTNNKKETQFIFYRNVIVRTVLYSVQYFPFLSQKREVLEHLPLPRPCLVSVYFFYNYYYNLFQE